MSETRQACVAAFRLAVQLRTRYVAETAEGLRHWEKKDPRRAEFVAEELRLFAAQEAAEQQLMECT